MLSHEFLKVPDDVAMLTPRSELTSMLAPALGGRAVHPSSAVDEFVAFVIARRTRTVVIDLDAEGAQEALRRINLLPSRSSLHVILVARDPVPEVMNGDADIVVIGRALVDAVGIVTPASGAEDRPIALDRLLGVSMLGRSLDKALENAADQLAAGFGVDRCVISLREDSTGGAASGTRTWSSLTWNHTADRCRAAIRAGASLIAPVPDDPHAPCETYLAVPLETAMGSNGFVGLVESRPRRFSAEMRSALEKIAGRLAAEVSWRGAHERASEELDRLVSGPGIDSLLGVWNRHALEQLTVMQLSAALRNKVPLGAVVLDIVALQAINHAHGHETGDRVLRRVAEAVRATVREEDIVGRWSGDAIAIVLQGIGPEGCQRVAERVRAAVDQRPLELHGSDSLVIPVTVGIASVETNETATQLLTRAASAALKAQASGAPFVHAGAQPSNPRLSGEIALLSEDVTSTLGGTYRLLHEISRGGMGVVYRAQDRALERPVAIKMLRPDLAEDPELVERFRIEAAMLAHIRHPNLVQIYSFGHSGGDSYFVMELVEGESLEQAFERHIAERTVMPLVDVPSVILQIASALDALHERGIIHRDVKPANVIRDPFRSRCVLVDVGIARKYGQNARTAGTPGFVAPEVVGGADASVRSDVYGLAATAYTMLTLQRPWGEGDLPALMARQCSNDLRRPSELRAELLPIDDVLMRALDADPEKRQASAGEFAKELVEHFPIIMPRDRRSSESARPLRKPAVAPTPKTPSRTRGVVFRSVPRALGARETEKLRDALSTSEPELVDALADGAPLAWLPTELLGRLFAVAAKHTSRDPATFARDIAKAAVRGSFRRFFPASAATLVPETTLSAIRNVWSRYQSWGEVSSMPVQPTEHVVRLVSHVRDPLMCAWTSGLLEQVVVLSGAASATSVHDACQSDGAEACLFRVRWELA